MRISGAAIESGGGRLRLSLQMFSWRVGVEQKLLESREDRRWRVDLEGAAAAAAAAEAMDLTADGAEARRRVDINMFEKELGRNQETVSGKVRLTANRLATLGVSLFAVSVSPCRPVPVLALLWAGIRLQKSITDSSSVESNFAAALAT